jgi:hypothetical protein
MVAPNVREIYDKHIRPLDPADRLRLIELIARDTATPDTSAARKRSIMELHGLGAEMWQGVDAQEYVNELRKEWDHRP